MPTIKEVEKKNKDDAKKASDNEVRVGKKRGFTGTSITSGIIDEDYAVGWINLDDKVETIKRMVDGDGSTSAVLDAIKNPLLSAKYFIEEDNEIDQKLIDFANDFLFKYQSKGFQSFLLEALTFLEYGFCVFEKVPVIVDNKLFYDLQIRVQSSIDKWTIDGKPWVNNHPAGITQMITTTDESNTEFTAEIPWNKVFLLTHQRIGNNFEGKSILRRMNIHFKMIQMLYKISAVAAERFGVGVPYAKHKVGVNETFLDKMEEMLGNLTSNEQSYMLINDMVDSFGILTPDSNSQTSSINDLIKHHDKKIYDSVLAGFLNLSSGEGGSNALSKDQSGFFLRGLTGTADYYCEQINNLIRELVIFNFGKQDKYPKLGYSDIAQTSNEEYVNSRAKAKEAGLYTWTAEDENKIREQTKMPEIDSETRERLIKENNDLSVSNQEKLKDGEKMSELLRAILSEKKNIKLASKKKITEREREFTRGIGDYENYLESEFTNIVKVTEKTEDTISKKLKISYNKLDTEQINGVKVVARTSKNRKIEKEIEKMIDIEAAKLSDKLINSNIQKRLFDNTRKKVTQVLTKNDKLFVDVEIDNATIRSFVNGYISNVRGVLFNEPRRIKEEVVLNFGSQASIDLIVKQSDTVKFNRNILKLATITHPRGAFNAIVYEDSTNKGFNLLKLISPKQKIKNIAPSGMTSKWIYVIIAAAILNEAVSEETNGKNTDAVSGLGLHHGSFTYNYPISTENLEEEEEIAKQQRAELNDLLEAQK